MKITNFVLGIHSKLIEMYPQQSQSKLAMGEFEAAQVPYEINLDDIDQPTIPQQACQGDLASEDFIDWSTFDFNNIGQPELDPVPLSSSHDKVIPRFDLFEALDGVSIPALPLEPGAVDDSGYVSRLSNIEDAANKEKHSSKCRWQVGDSGLYI